MVVWEKRTLGLMKEIEDEKERMNRTDYKRALKPRKPRPRHIIGDEKYLASTSSALLAKMNLEEEVKRRCQLGKQVPLAPLLGPPIEEHQVVESRLSEVHQESEEQLLEEPISQNKARQSATEMDFVYEEGLLLGDSEPPRQNSHKQISVMRESRRLSSQGIDTLKSLGASSLK